MQRIYTSILIGIPVILISFISMSVFSYSPKNMDHVVRLESPKTQSLGNNSISKKKFSSNLVQTDLTHYNSEQMKFPNSTKYVTTSADVSRLIESGIAAMESQKPETALFYFNHALNLAPRRENALYQRAQTYYLLKRLPEALHDINKAINQTPNNTKFYSLRGQILRDNNNHFLAISDFSKSIQLNPNDPDLYFQRGILFSLTNHTQNALFDFSQAINLDPNMSSAFYERAILLERLNEITLAENDYNHAEKLDMETK